VEDSCLQRESSLRKEASGISVFLLEELGDARLRCAQLKKYIDEAVALIDKSEHRDHFFEVASHLIYGIPDTLLRLDKALSASALAASKMDYEEIKDDLRPEKVEQLERALEEVRIRRVRRQSTEGPMNIQEAVEKLEHFASQIEKEGQLNPIELAGFIDQLEEGHKTASETTEIPEVLRSLSAGLQDTSRPESRPSRVALASTLRRVLASTLDVSALKVASDEDDDDSKEAQEAKESRFEEGKPADPTKNMSPEEAKKWEENTDKYEDKFKKAASDDDDKKESRFEEGKPADPTQNMSPEDAKKWKTEHNKNKDKFKAASAQSKRATMERPIIEAMKKAYFAGQEAGDPEAREELENAYKELLESGKTAMRSRTTSLGAPSGHMANMAAALWEFAYWWGGLSSLNNKTASEDPWKSDQPRQAAEIETPKEVFYGIMGREKGKGKMKPFDYANGRFVTNVIYQTLWGDKRHVEKLVDEMNKMNEDYEFVVKKRT
jgi:hypothetical protein